MQEHMQALQKIVQCARLHIHVKYCKYERVIGKCKLISRKAYTDGYKSISCQRILSTGAVAFFLIFSFLIYFSYAIHSHAKIF